MSANSAHESRIEFFKVIFAQIIEKLLRLENFISEAEKQARSGREFNIVANIKRVLEEEKKRLFDKIEAFEISKNNQFTIIDQETHIDFLLKFSDRLNRSHKLLKWIYSPWPEEETNEFLYRVFNGHPQYEEIFKDSKPNVGFVDEYNFFQYEEGQKIIFPPGGEGLSIPVFSLPKIEKNNPLIWPLLIHELAHEICKKFNLGPKISARLNGVKIEKTQILEDWITEFCSDLISLHLLGPAYIFPLVYIMLTEISENLHEAKEKHPPPANRIGLMKEVLENDLNFSITHQKMKDIRYAIELINQRLLLDNERRHNLDKADDSYQAEKFFSISNTFRETIEKIIKEVKSFCKREKILIYSYNNQVYDNSLELAEKLQLGLQICSTRSKNNIIKIRSILESSPEKINKNYFNILDLLDERPSTIIEILTAGWIHKIWSQTNWFTKYFLNNDKKIFDKFENYKKAMLHFDILHIKSIQTSLVHSFYE